MSRCIKKIEGSDFDKLCEVLSTLKNKKLELNNIVTEKYKVLLENPDFEQEVYSRTATGIYKIGRDNARVLN